MPPSVQWSCVAGSGPKVRSCCSAASRSVSSTMPGSTRAERASRSISSTRFMYFEKSITTATLQHWPARLVPPPRAEDRARRSGGRARPRRRRRRRRAGSRRRSAPGGSSRRRSRRAPRLPASNNASPSMLPARAAARAWTSMSVAGADHSVCERHGRQQRVVGLTRIESGVLHDDRRVGTHDAGEVGVGRDLFRIAQVVEAHVPRRRASTVMRNGPAGSRSAK